MARYGYTVASKSWNMDLGALHMAFKAFEYGSIWSYDLEYGLQETPKIGMYGSFQGAAGLMSK